MTSGPRDEDRPPGRRFDGAMTRALVAVGAFVAMIVVAAGAIALETAITGDNPTTSDPGDRMRVYYLDKGDCFDAGPTLDRHGEVTVLDCGDAHDSEVVRIEHFSTFGSEGAEAEEEADREARDECRDELEAYVDQLPAAVQTEPRLYRDNGSINYRDRGMDQVRWTVACVAWRAG